MRRESPVSVVDLDAETDDDGIGGLVLDDFVDIEPISSPLTEGTFILILTSLQ